LNQLTSGATSLPVTAGPVEATAAGNVLVQLMTLREIRSLDEGRSLIRDSFPTRTVEPRQAGEWQAARETMATLEFP
jgi:rhamnulokinase